MAIRRRLKGMLRFVNALKVQIGLGLRFGNAYNFTYKPEHTFESATDSHRCRGRGRTFLFVARIVRALKSSSAVRGVG